MALSLAAALGMLVGGVYSGVTGWQGPAGGMAGGSSTTRTTASAGSGLPTPNERPSPAAKPRPPVETVRTAQVWTVDRPDTGGPTSAAGPAKDKPDEDRDRQDENGDGDGRQAEGEHGDQSKGEHGGKAEDEHGNSHRHDPAKDQQVNQ